MTSDNTIIKNVRFDDNFSILSNTPPEDPLLSWEGKGVLWYLLTRPKNWQIHYWQLMQVYEGPKQKSGGRDAIKTIMAELKERKYLYYKKTRDELGRWQHNYIVFPMPYDQFKEMFPKDFQKMFPETDYPEPVYPEPDSPETVNPPIIPNKEFTKEVVTKKKQQQRPAAAFFKCLASLELSDQDKRYLTDNFPQTDVEHAVKWATHPTTKINKSLIQAIKWAIKEKPDIPVQPQDLTKDNAITAMEIAKKTILPPFSYIEILHDSVEVGFKTGQKHPVVISFLEKGFVEQFTNAIRKHGGNFLGS